MTIQYNYSHSQCQVCMYNNQIAHESNEQLNTITEYLCGNCKSTTKHYHIYTTSAVYNNQFTSNNPTISFGDIKIPNTYRHSICNNCSNQQSFPSMKMQVFFKLDTSSHHCEKCNMQQWFKHVYTNDTNESSPMENLKPKRIVKLYYDAQQDKWTTGLLNLEIFAGTARIVIDVLPQKAEEFPTYIFNLPSAVYDIVPLAIKNKVSVDIDTKGISTLKISDSIKLNMMLDFLNIERFKRDNIITSGVVGNVEPIYSC